MLYNLLIYYLFKEQNKNLPAKQAPPIHLSSYTPNKPNVKAGRLIFKK